MLQHLAAPTVQRYTWRDLRRLLKTRPLRQPDIRYAVQDSFALVAGTSFTWKASGGTYAMTLTSLGSGSLRQGVKSSTLVATPSGLSTAVLPEELRITLLTQMTSAPTANKTVELYLGFSDSATAGTDNPAGLSGTDAAGPNVDTLGQLVFAGAVVLSNNLSTGAQLQYMVVRPLDAYVSPVVYNNSDVAIDGTAGHHILTMTPYYRLRDT